MALSLDAEAVAVHQRSVGRSAARFVSAVTEQNEAIRGRGEVRLETGDLVIGEEADGIAPGAPDAWALAYGRDPKGRPEVLAGPNAEVEVWVVTVDADDRDALARTLWLLKRHARRAAAAVTTTVAAAARLLDAVATAATACFLPKLLRIGSYVFCGNQNRHSVTMVIVAVVFLCAFVIVLAFIVVLVLFAVNLSRRHHVCRHLDSSHSVRGQIDRLESTGRVCRQLKACLSQPW